MSTITSTATKGNVARYETLLRGASYEGGKRVLHREMMDSVKQGHFGLLSYVLHSTRKSSMEDVLKDVVRKSAWHFDRKNQGRLFNKLVHTVHTDSLLLQQTMPKRDILYFSNSAQKDEPGITLTFNVKSHEMTSYSPVLSKRQGLKDMESAVAQANGNPVFKGGEELRMVREILTDMAARKQRPDMANAIVKSRSANALANMAASALKLY